jgi:hypothetical protein
MSCSAPVEDSDGPTTIKLDILPSAELLNVSGKIQGNYLVTIKYAWETGPDFTPPLEDLTVKVHFVDAGMNILWQDDHKPVTEITSWQPNQAYQYERIVYIPLIPRLTPVTMLMGMYGTDPTKYALNGTMISRDKYQVNSFSVSPPRKPEDLPGAKIDFQDGWYDQERNIATRESWRWMGANASCKLRNPDRDATLYLRGWMPTEIIKSDSTITLFIDGNVFSKTENVSYDFEILKPIPLTLFADKDFITLDLTTDHSYVPVQIGLGNDPRELGIMFKIIYFN